MRLRFINVLLDPNPTEGGGGSAAGANIAQESAAQLQGGSNEISFNPNEEAVSSGAGQGTAQPGAGASGVADPAGSAAGAGSDQWESVLDFARGLGYDFGGREYQDERQFLRDILTQAQQSQQANYYAQLGQQLAPHAQGIQQYLQQQQAPAQPAQRQPWEAPEFNEQWLNLVDRDPSTGVFLAKPGVDPSIASKVNEYARWREQVSLNPAQAIQPFVENQVKTLAQQQFQQMFADYQRQQEVQSIVQANTEWMYQHDASGRPVIGLNGRPVATPEGARYGQIVQQLEAAGMSSPRQIDQFARLALMGEMAQRQNQQQAQAPPAVQQRNALASSRSQQNVLQSLAPQQRQQTAGATEPNAEGMALNDMIRQAFDQAGYSEADFNNPEMLTG